MSALTIAGIALTLIGLAGLTYCIAKAYKAKKLGLTGEELTKHLQGLVAINLGAFFLSAIGLALVIFGILF
ncbi:hypothetical protein GCM10008927_09350 [Amylibacter ulvae]|uniref:Uncharacterized protein n=1 Tax=Paramylibacter ulvae TaxID=1651968 RepID=A0ABQ3CW96_9RHOB|nr:hypothetical protein [Amylibacter ulvae]GHA46276.1 hypothetical protein GCM10008927_09350 [Amylibacter ulvae]